VLKARLTVSYFFTRSQMRTVAREAAIRDLAALLLAKKLAGNGNPMALYHAALAEAEEILARTAKGKGKSE